MDIILAGSAGRIQASYHAAGGVDNPIAVIFHDSPLAGGSMNEPVAYTLFYTFLKKGFSVLRFNFRGVGGTEGEFEGGDAELADASTAVDWLQRAREESKTFFLAGVGFGAWIAHQMVMRRMEITNYMAVKPPVKKFDYSFFNPASCPGLVMGSRDVPQEEEILKSFVASVNRQKAGKATLAMLEGSLADNLGEIYTVASEYIDKSMK